VADPVIIGDCTLYLGDCREVLPTLGKVDAVVTDPPYGIGESSKRAATRGRSSALVKRAYQRDYGGNDKWDHEPPSSDTIKFMREMSAWQVFFGGNFFDLPPSSCWLVWDKLNSGDFADCELAWTNLPKAVRRIQYRWNGMIREERDIPREHLTQKPIGVMTWAIGHIPPSSLTILDPFMGSGTTGVACVKLGRKFIGIEIEERYFDIACKRIEAAEAQPDLFIEAAPKQEQLALFEVAA